MGISRAIKAVACTIVVFHILALWRTGTVGGGSLFSNLAQLAAAVLAVVSCLLASRRMHGFARRFWFLMGMSFLIWAIAQCGWIYSEDVLHQPVPTILWINVCFFFFMAPMGAALLLPPDNDSKDKRPTFYLDVLQLCIVVVTAYLYFMIPSLWYGQGIDLNQQIRISSELRNYILLAAFLIRLSLTPTAKIKPFKQMAIVLAIYSGAESLYFHATRVAVINTGLWFDLGWSIPFALAAVFACSDEEVEALNPSSRQFQPWKTTLAFHVMPLLTPVLVIALAARMVKEQLLLAAISIAASVSVAIARVFVSDLNSSKASVALKETEEKYRILFVNNPHPMWVVDVESAGILDVNDAAIQKYGFTREEFLTKTIADIRAPEEIPMIEVDRAHFKQHRTLSRELMHRTRDGRIFPASATAREITVNGKRAVIVLAEDISERRKAEEELRKSQQMLQLHLQQTPLAFIEWDADGRIIDWNNAAQRIFGYTKEEAMGKTAELLATPAFLPQVAEIQKQLIAGKGGTHGTNPNLRKDKKTIICDWYNTVIANAGGDVLGMASLVQDVTEQRNLEEKLRQSQKMEAIGTLAGGVAHDFNNLLTVISGYTSLVDCRFKEKGEVIKELKDVMEASDRAAALTSQLLTFSRKQITQTVVLDLNDCVRRIENMLKRMIGEDIKLDTDLSGDLLPIKADSGQIDQVIMNLAVNARDAMPKGGTLRFTTANIKAEDIVPRAQSLSGPIVSLRVSDSGCGMDPSTMEHIFEPFFTTKKGKGTGLGLSTVFGIVESAGGVISVDSGPNLGTTFHLFFPTASTPAFLEQKRRTTGLIAGKETILLVEDERSVRDLASVILRSYGYKVLIADSGTAAETISQEFTPAIDLLMTDVVMPGMSGPETAQRLRLQRPGLKILYTSGYTDNELTRSALSSNAGSFLQKPFSPVSLATKIREVLDAPSATAASSV
jgi:two-component system cell cycle sensor histidine kinase/response regulator CckA